MANEKLVLEIVAEISDLQRKMAELKNLLQATAQDIPISLNIRKIDQDIHTVQERLKNIKPTIEPVFQPRATVEKATAETALSQLREKLQSFTPSVSIRANIDTTQAQQSMTRLVATTESLRNTIVSAMRQVAIEVSAVVLSFEKLKNTISDIVGVGEKMQRVQFALTQLYGSQEKGAEAFKNILELSSQVPVPLDNLLNAAVKLKSVGIEPLDGSLKALASAIVSFGGTGQDLELVALALQQMVSKGTLSMEELKQQLGERVPNAIQKMMQVLGYSENQMWKFFQDVQKGTVDSRTAVMGFVEALKQEPDITRSFISTLPGALNALKVELQKIALELGEAGFFDAIVKAVQKLGNELKKPEIKEGITTLGQALGGMVQTLAGFIPALSEVAKFFIGFAQLVKTVAQVVIAFGTTAYNTIMMLLNLPALAIAKLSGNEKRFQDIKENIRVWATDIKTAWGMVTEEGKKLLEGVDAQIEKIKQQTEEGAKQSKKQQEQQNQKAQDDARRQKEFRDRLEEFEKNIKREDMLLKMREARLQAHASVLKSFQQKDELSILFKLDIQLEDENFQEKKEKLLKRKQEIEELLSQAPQGQALEKLVDEYEKVQNQIDQIELEHANRRVQLVANYVEKAKEKLQELAKAYKDTAEEATRELQKMNKAQEEINKKSTEPLRNIPPNMRDRLQQLLGLSVDFSGVMEFGNAFSLARQKYEEFMSAVRSGADFETLKKLKQDFLEARDGVISFLKSLSPTQTIDIFRTLGFSEGFLPSVESLKPKLMSLFGMAEEEARNTAQRLSSIWTNAMSNVSQAFRLMPELSQFFSPEQLLGMQLQRGLADVFLEDMKSKTKEIFDTLSQSIQQQIQQTQNFISELMNMLQGGAVMPIRLDLSQAEQQLRELASRELVIPARLQVQQEGVYR